ncbi:hypothetical protein KSP40_PGU016317 [Platanthera guangdongensis]|uniref:Uncharacterized protein n=1 Tax=Platanthera guangdongensis TaxID=2320717 RepID=A0ABR2MPM8_9ASPA
MRPSGEAKSISGHQTSQLMRRIGEALCHTPCLPKVRRGRARRASTTQGAHSSPTGGRRRPSRGTSRLTCNTGKIQEGNPIGSQRIHNTRSLTDQ